MFILKKWGRLSHIQWDFSGVNVIIANLNNAHYFKGRSIRADGTDLSGSTKFKV